MKIQSLKSNLKPDLNAETALGEILTLYVQWTVNYKSWSCTDGSLDVPYPRSNCDSSMNNQGIMVTENWNKTQ